MRVFELRFLFRAVGICFVGGWEVGFRCSFSGCSNFEFMLMTNHESRILEAFVFVWRSFLNDAWTISGSNSCKKRYAAVLYVGWF